eukprot:485865-Alexandrium_andersonii.AAC.1
MVPPHEALAAEVGDSVPTPEAVERAAATADWGPAWRANPHAAAARAEGATAVPCALYLDGVRFTRSIGTGRQDSFVGFYTYNLLTGKRHVAGLLRRSELCRCGCRGWCSLYQ